MEAQGFPEAVLKGRWGRPCDQSGVQGGAKAIIWRPEVIFFQSAAEGSERCQSRQRREDVCALKRMSREQDKGKLRQREPEDEAGMCSELNRPSCFTWEV